MKTYIDTFGTLWHVPGEGRIEIPARPSDWHVWTGTDWVEDIAAKQAQNIRSIKAKAGEIIITRLPDYKQRNYLARKAELQDILIAGNLLSKEEQAEWDFLTAEWTWAKSIRAASNEAESAGTPVDSIVWPV